MHEHFDVVLINKDGETIGYKPRREINKRKDTFCTVYTFVFDQDNNLGLAVISSDNKLPNLYSGRFGVTTASILRKDESIEEAAVRSLRNELGLKNIKSLYIGESMEQIGEQSLRKMIIFVAKVNQNDINIDTDYVEDVKFVSLNDVEETIIDEDAFSPVFVFLWKKYKDQILSIIKT